MRVTIEFRRPRRRSLILLFGLVLLGVPAAAWANHAFPDVPTGNPFHNDIDAIADAGITGGFGDGGYHPGEPVTRQAMAAFMHRGYGRVGQVGGGTPIGGSVTVAAGASYSPAAAVRQITITVPGATNAFAPNQFVLVYGRVEFNSAFDAYEGCPCEFTAWIRDTSTNAAPAFASETFYSHVSKLFQRGIEVVGVFDAPPGAHTYILETYLNDRDTTTNQVSYAMRVESKITAMTFPFGSTGGDTL
ncbi:MAG TPA: S-layer homology domain-containing protein [Vicinamibacterales bacterium]|nr:S-layer homology domain-containing protein [Vicinamibacterales bacterium]